MGAAGRLQEGRFTSGEDSEKVGLVRDRRREYVGTALHCNDRVMVRTFALCRSLLLLIHGHTHRPGIGKAGL